MSLKTATWPWVQLHQIPSENLIHRIKSDLPAGGKAAHLLTQQDGPFLTAYIR